MAKRRDLLQAGLWGLTALPTWAMDDPTGGDPLGSMQWPDLRRKYAQDAPLRFTDAVRVLTPAFADDALNVPLQIDARALQAQGGGIARMTVIADRNPIREVLTFEPLRALPLLAFRLRLEQASPIRCLVQTQDGHWHVGGAMAQAAGGGCTVPGVTRANGSWSQTLNQVQARFFTNLADASRRLRLQVMHPMDTGLVAGIPAFYIEQLELRDASGQPWWRLALHEPVSENPLITLEMPSEGPRAFRLLGQDNNGNRIDAEVRA
ncbi:MAG: quinoprotein dehydrogenase-associated SoxYZ-like carrier [Comamonadaceae bacterium]|jgi:sulfur-oxidizing protein SoxY|nr:quinoprotein dehydrogenase-associated SoxYZ-like carrier [Comamonadaceae bacterium]